jgi:hypothetical protein
MHVSETLASPSGGGGGVLHQINHTSGGKIPNLGGYYDSYRSDRFAMGR